MTMFQRLKARMIDAIRVTSFHVSGRSGSSAGRNYEGEPYELEYDPASKSLRVWATARAGGDGSKGRVVCHVLGEPLRIAWNSVANDNELSEENDERCHAVAFK